jgi:hypothetical protein
MFSYLLKEFRSDPFSPPKLPSIERYEEEIIDDDKRGNSGTTKTLLE